VPDDQAEVFAEMQRTTACDAYAFAFDQAGFALREHFAVQSLDGFGCTEMKAAVGAAGAILHYLKNCLRRQVGHITRLSCYRNTSFMVVDAATQTNLDLVASRGSRDTSLLAALDRTVTPMGARKLRDWILHPLCDIAALNRRQQLIADLIAEQFLLSQTREALKAIRDIERTVSRLNQAGGNARDLAVLRSSLEEIPNLKGHLAALRQHIGLGAFGKPETGGGRPETGNLSRAERDRPADISQSDPAKPETCEGTQPEVSGLRSQVSGLPLVETIHAELHELPALLDLLRAAIVDEPPMPVKEGGMIRDGFDTGLDELRAATSEGKNWIAQLQQRLIDETGIKSLKVRFTSVFGYFIEVTKSNLANVPPTWHRKQTIATGERYITPELKEVEGKILGADERAKALEFELFGKVRDDVLRELPRLQETAAAIATLDVLASLAETARLFGYCRPVLTDDLRIVIRDGRHPVLDQSLVEEKFVPNDSELDGQGNRLAIITGPNMAGKSTYIRQVALLTLMAQIGSFVPAASAEIGIADRIFTRVGASDDIARGQSTFMVEMNETANIMNNATERSLVILDEIGRGTSTFDGLSIAWSVAEYLHDKLKARTLFATHYHELTELELTRGGVKNYNIAVREWNDQVIFLRKIVKGGADKSYGIQVARLAGLPPEIIARAKEILANLELAELNADGRPKLAEHPPAPKFGKPRGKKRAAKALAAMPPQMSLFS
jgi:DNA mismatch repair protein MutS